MSMACPRQRALRFESPSIRFPFAHGSRAALTVYLDTSVVLRALLATGTRRRSGAHGSARTRASCVEPANRCLPPRALGFDVLWAPGAG